MFFIAALFTGCWYDNEEDMFGEVECITTEMSYSNDIAPILQGNGCVGCHNNSLQSGGVNLEGYENVKSSAETGKLLGTINHDDGFKPMPQGMAKIENCQIEKIKAWIEQGTLNN